MITIDHDVIRAWAEARGGRPSRVIGSGQEPTDILRLDFGMKEDGLEEISWEDFFEIFEENNLAFLYQEMTEEGEESRFFKFVDRDSVDAKDLHPDETIDDDEDDADELDEEEPTDEELEEISDEP